MTKRKREVIGCLLILYSGFYLLYLLHSYASFFISSSTSHISITESDVSFHRRKLLNEDDEAETTTSSWNVETNCTPPDIEQFPRPLINNAARKKGGLIVHIFMTLYMFLGLAIICDEYFVPSLEKMCKSLSMSSDVAGATFMAAGSSAPELATAVIAVFIAKDDIGVGTVVGSAVFNIAFVIGICGLFGGCVVHLNWWPMFRDCAFYLISILGLLFALRDEDVSWIESTILLALYMLYIVFMMFNEQMEEWVKKQNCFSCLNRYLPSSINGVSYHSLPDMPHKLSESSSSSDRIASDISSVELSLPAAQEEHSVFTPPEGCCRKCIWGLSLPLLLFCFVTIPDCKKQRWETWFFLTFLMSCVWIGFLSYILVWMITIIGFTLNIKDTVMGLTFLAAGASIPDAISSLIVAREGLGDMAVSNAVGSNVFDILLCLGLPWFVQTAIVKPGSHILVRSKGLTYSTLTLLLTVVFLLAATHLNKWKLDKKYGAILLVWYGVFMVVAIMYESSLFGNSSFPTCPSDF